MNLGNDWGENTHKKSKKERSKRLDMVVKLRNSGKTYKAIGEVLGVTRERVRQLDYSAKKIKEVLENKDSDDIFYLPTRLLNICKFHNLLSREQIRQAVDDGRLNPKGRYVKNLGRKGYGYLLEWLGHPALPDMRKFKRCPHCGGKLTLGGNKWQS